METFRGKKGVLIGAPHGTFDRHTDVIAAALIQRTKMSGVIARGYRVAGLSVVRPTEEISIPPPPCHQLPFTFRARHVYEEYVSLMKEASQGPIRLYFEVHGNRYPPTQDAVEIASAGIAAAEAQKLKARFLEIQSAVLAKASRAARVGIRMEPDDRVFWSATCTKRDGTLSEVAKGFQIELPWEVRQEPSRDAYIDVLERFFVAAEEVLV
jgi:hypothetical protein